MSYFETFYLYRYVICKDCIELHGPGCVITLIDEKDINEVLQWIKDARRINVDPCKYVNYMIKEQW